jgi:hypothetical protein
VYGAVNGPFALLSPLLVLAAPFAGLNLAGRYLYRQERRAVAVAFFLAGVCLLPLFLLIVFDESGWLQAPPGTPGQILDDAVSNRQLQVTLLIACAWAAWLALATKTMALSTVFTFLMFLFSLAVLSDFGLKSWFENRQADYFALHLAPLVVTYAALGRFSEKKAQPWLASALYVGAALTLVVVLDFLAVKGQTLHYVGMHLEPLTSESHPTLDATAAFVMNGILFYLIASAVERLGSEQTATSQSLLFAITPFSILEPLAYLSGTKDYSATFNWVYLGMAVTIALLSHARQRRSFYYAGVLNSGSALLLIAARYEWYDDPYWGTVIVILGLGTLILGYLLDSKQRGTGPAK